MLREGILRPDLRLTALAASLAAVAALACNTVPVGRADAGDPGILGRGEVPGQTPILIDAAGTDQTADEPADAIPAGDVATMEVAATAETGTADGPPPAVVGPPPGTMCAAEKVHDGLMFAFAGGPNYGDGKGVGLCGYPNALLPRGRFFGAVDSALFGNTAACGSCVRIENAAGSVKVEVQIIDLVDPMLPGGPPVVSADLAVQRMFSPAGNPPVKFAFVPCSTEGNLQTAFDTTTTTNSSLLVMNHRTSLADVQMMSAGGWRSLGRTRFNRWAIPFTIDSKANALRFVDVYGRKIDLAAVPFASTLQDTGAQFPPCPGF
jgi:hypothetical protein